MTIGQNEFDMLRDTIEGGFRDMESNSQRIETTMKDGFDRVDKRFEKMEIKLNGHNNRITDVEKENIRQEEQIGGLGEDLTAKPSAGKILLWVGIIVTIIVGVGALLARG
jgi:hypothetical protein